MKTHIPGEHHAAALLIALASTLGARATRPGGDPAFTDPLNITNVWQPFQPGGVKVFAGSRDGRRVVTVDSYLDETRTFIVHGQRVTCRIMQELSCEDGEIVEVSRNYFAQADHGAVYYFGEVVDLYRDGVVSGHEGSWLVGGATLPDDPPETLAVSDPGLILPAHPAGGTEAKMSAPGAGEMLARARGERQQLIATSFTA